VTVACDEAIHFVLSHDLGSYHSCPTRRLRSHAFSSAEFRTRAREGASSAPVPKR
jgi:hypothetical protein